MFRLLGVFGLLFSLVWCSSCEVINPEEEIPAYVHFEGFDFTAGSGQGSSSSRISEVFVFIGTDFQGAYSVPLTFPVLASGEHSMDFLPAVQENGIASTPGIYPLYEFVTLSVNLSPEVTDTLKPAITYVDGLTFPILETFDNNLHVFRDDKDMNDNTEITISETDVFEGGASGLIVLTADDPIIEVASTRMTELPIGGTPVFLELNYKNNVPFELGIYFETDDGLIDASFAHGLNISEEWNKVYINMTNQFDQLANVNNLKDYQIGIRSVMPRDGENYAAGSREILIDNFKFIYQEN